MKRFAFALMVGLSGTSTAALADGDAARGKTLFSRCSACHATTEQNKIGPHLSGVVGRAAGSMPGFAYSKAMVDYAKVWDDTTLDAFLAAPNKVVRGTKMTAGAMTNTRDRADIIAYLREVSQ
ncbi:cytochrome c family protein (plasmid) [Agrobacterium tumefaciens]|uniref:Cytochrome c family protein n=1 Tax=Agrobacterium tumefaciens TaxID=358 RepID=A0AAJ4N851_AGRTU|nr:cytochrome c family protein [Agrobacterium tumefaciens]